MPRPDVLGVDFAAVPAVGHRITTEGIAIYLPAGRLLTDDEASKLAWAILADLVPDLVPPVPVVVTYREGARLQLLAAMREGAASIDTLSGRLGWQRRKTERRLHDLLADGRAERLKISPHDVRFRVTER